MDPVEWTVSDVIEKIRKLALGNTLYKIGGGEILTCLCSRCFSLLWQRGCWQRRLLVLFVGRDMMDPVEWTVSDVIEKIRKLAVGNCY